MGRASERYIVHKLLDPLPTDRGVGDPDWCFDTTVNEILCKVPARGSHVEEAVGWVCFVPVLQCLEGI
jgi:hypothetical protein